MLIAVIARRDQRLDIDEPHLGTRQMYGVTNDGCSVFLVKGRNYINGLRAAAIEIYLGKRRVLEINQRCVNDLLRRLRASRTNRRCRLPADDNIGFREKQKQ